MVVVAIFGQLPYMMEYLFNYPPWKVKRLTDIWPTGQVKITQQWGHHKITINLTLMTSRGTKGLSLEQVTKKKVTQGLNREWGSPSTCVWSGINLAPLKDQDPFPSSLFFKSPNSAIESKWDCRNGRWVLERDKNVNIRETCYR